MAWAQKDSGKWRPTFHGPNGVKALVPRVHGAVAAARDPDLGGQRFAWQGGRQPNNKRRAQLEEWLTYRIDGLPPTRPAACGICGLCKWAAAREAASKQVEVIEVLSE